MIMGRNWPKTWYYRGNRYTDYGNTVVLVRSLSTMLCRHYCSECWRC